MYIYIERDICYKILLQNTSETDKLMVIVSPDRRISYLSTNNKFTICLTKKKKKKFELQFHFDTVV